MSKKVEEVKEQSKGKQTLWEAVKYSLVACVAGVSEFVSYTVLAFALASFTKEFHWFVFNYSAEDGGLGVMIAYLVSAVIGQVITYVVNRKTTFKANNDPVKAAIGFAIMVVFIICAQSYCGPILNAKFEAFASAKIASESIAGLIGTFGGKAVMMFVTLIFTFFMNKFVIMKHTDEKQDAEKTEENE